MDYDQYFPFDMQCSLLQLILRFDELARVAIARGVEMQDLLDIPAKEKIGRAKALPVETYAQECEAIMDQMAVEIEALAGGEEQ